MKGNIAKIRAALEQEPGASRSQAIAALAELEKSSGRSSARMSWEICGCQTPPTHYVGTMPCPLNPTPPPAKPAPQGAASEVTDEVCERICESFLLAITRRSKPDSGRVLIAAVRSELGPALGMVEIREPTPEECERIDSMYASLDRTSHGRAMFDAVRAVMWPKEGL